MKISLTGSRLAGAEGDLCFSLRGIGLISSSLTLQSSNIPVNQRTESKQSIYSSTIGSRRIRRGGEIVGADFEGRRISP